VKADTETKLIRAFKVTSANVHDSQVIESLREKEDEGEPIYADSAYRSESIEQMCINKRVESSIHEKGYRNNPLSTKQKKINKKKSKIRARLENIFAFMENTINSMYLYYRNLKRINTGIGLMNMTIIFSAWFNSMSPCKNERDKCVQS
jgi:IS5 family transposase